MNQIAPYLFLSIWLLTAYSYSQGTDSFTEDTSVPFRSVTFSSSAFADVDSDGDQDVLITGFDNNERISNLYLNDGTGTFTEDLNAGIDGVSHSAVAFADVDGDDDPDLLITGGTGSGSSPSSRIATLYLNDGSGKFTPTSNPFEGVYIGSIAFSDVDGDTDLDVLITGLNSTNIATSKLYLNNGTGIFTEDTSVPFPGVLYSSVAFADVDGDDDQDVLITGNSGSSRISKLFLNNGSGTFTENASASFIAVQYGAVAFADIDGDNDQDILITGQYSNANSTSRLYLNDGSGVFTFKSTGFISVYHSSIALSDIDLDGDPDVMINGISTNIVGSQLSFNDGNADFPATMLFDEAPYGSVNFADVNDDDKPDLLITGSGIAKLYLNAIEVTKPVITIDSQPIDIQDCEGTNVSFSVAASGTSNLKYQWQEDQGNGFSNLTDGGSVNGSLANQLIISNIQLVMDNFQYRCVISGDNADDVISTITFLNVTSIPTPPSSIDNTGCTSESIVLMASGGSDGKYRWYQAPTGGTAISGEVNNSYTTPTLTVTTSYYVSVTNGICESARTEVVASVISPVSITSQPIDQTVDEGAHANFSITVSGESPFFQWQKDGVDISGETSNNFMINSAQQSDAGMYTCIVTNDCGTVTSDQAVLAVNELEIPLNLESSVNFSIYPNPTIRTLYIDGLTPESNWSVIFMDLSGKEVGRLTLSQKNNRLDVTHFPKGIYRIRIIKDLEEIYASRIILK